jgi:hypothetical protein
MDNQQFVSTISQLRPSSTFLTLHKYASDSGELADYNIVFNISYKAALQRSIDTLNAMTLTTDLEKQARNELLESFATSLAKDEETQEEDDGTYRRFYDEEGNPIKGVRLHKDTDTLHLYGLVLQKRTYLPGTYKKVNSKPLTIAKNKLRALTSCGKFRSFIIDATKVDSISVQGLSLLPVDAF